MKNAMDYTCYDWFLCYKQVPTMPFTDNYMFNNQNDMMEKTEPMKKIDTESMCDMM